MMRLGLRLCCGATLALASPALAQDDLATLRQQLSDAQAQLANQRAQLEQQEERLRALEARLASPPRAAATVATANSAPNATSTLANGNAVSNETLPALPGIESVGIAPEDQDRPIELAVLGEQGSVVTRQGQLTGELQFDYTRADRNRAVFRGIEVIQSVLVGVFDINESHQDFLSASAALRYGLTDRIEIGARLPYIYRSDAAVLTPIQGSTQDDAAATVDTSATGSGIGDLELSARYQLVDGKHGWPFLIGNLQAVLPTGTDPFGVPRDSLGRELKAATGAGFFGITPSLTAVLPTDPVVLFGTLGYTLNLAKHENTKIPPVIIDYVDPGDAISFTAGIGVSFNPRTTLNLGYAHTWAFGTRTRTRLIDPQPGQPETMDTLSRDLQIGRFLFGVTYRLNDRVSLNWSVDVGATDDAPDVHTTLRIPLVLLTGK